MRATLVAVFALIVAGCVDPKVPPYQLTAPTSTVPAAAPGAPASLALTATPGIGTSSARAEISVRVADASGVGVPGVAVQLSTTIGRLEPEVVTTAGDGRASASLVGATKARVTATAGAMTQTIDVNMLSAFTLTISARPRGAPREVIPISVTVQRFVPDLEFSAASIDFGDGGSAPLTLEGVPLAASLTHQYDRTGDYMLVASVTDSQGITQQATRVVTIEFPPDPPPPPPAPGPSYGVTIAASPNPVVQGNPTTLTATATLQNGATLAPNVYDWDCEGDGTFEKPNAGNVTTCTYSGSGTKTANVTAKNGTVTGSGSIPITVLADAPLHVDITASTRSPVLGSSITFTATVTSTGSVPAKLQWQWDDTNDGIYEVVLPNAQNPNPVNPNVRQTSYGTAGATTVKVRVFDALTGREATGTLTVTVVQFPSLGVTIDVVKTGTVVTFTATVTPSTTTVSSYIWNFGDQMSTTTTTTSNQAVHPYTALGTFTVTVTVTTTTGQAVIGQTVVTIP